jgi:hypothetical protein
MDNLEEKEAKRLKAREADKRYREKNKDKIKERNAARKEKAAARQKEYRQENKDIIKEKNRQYYLDNAEAYKEYRQENKEKIIEYCRDWRFENKEYVKAKRQENSLKRRNTTLKRKYGLCLDDFSRMMQEQEGKCAICLVKAEDTMNKKLYVDHNHLTGAVRALLCNSCNSGIGFLREDLGIIQRASDYLKKFS